MLKKLFLTTLAALALAACDKDDEIRYLSQNDYLQNGSLTGSNMHFDGTLTFTYPGSDTRTERNRWFEFAGGAGELVLYMHDIRIGSAAPRMQMRLYDLPYTPTGDKSLAFTAAEVVPQVWRNNTVGGGGSYQPDETYRITGLEGSVDGIVCRIRFTCHDGGTATYEGKLCKK